MIIIHKDKELLWQYYRQKTVSAANVINNVTEANTITYLSKITETIIGQTGKSGTKKVEIMVSLRYLSNVSRTLKISLINCEINFDLSLSKNAP